MNLTIITINLNNRDGLRRTMDSVVGQTCQDFEYVVIDGGSTDGSREVIMEHQERLAYWCSEPDRGIYNAMNKGVAHATGDYCLFLNSGDYLYNKDVVRDVLPELDGRYDIVHGKVWSVDSEGNTVPKKGHRNNGRYVNSIQLIGYFMPHQAIFINKHCLEKEPYDENYKILSDKKFFIRCYFLHHCSFLFIDKYISFFNTSGISQTDIESASIEHEMILSELFPSRLVTDISLLDPELIPLWKEIPTSYRLRKALIGMLSITIRVYKCFKRES